MYVELQFLSGVCVLRLHGRFNTGSDAEFTKTVADLRKAGVRKVVVNCSQLTYIDSTGIAYLIGLHNFATSQGGVVALSDVNERVYEVLEITQLDTVLPIYADEPAALHALTGEAVMTA